MENYKIVKTALIKGTYPLITRNYIYTNSKLYTQKLAELKTIDIHFLSELDAELLYIADNSLFSLTNGLVATLDSKVAHFSANDELAIGTENETIILDNSYEVKVTYSKQIKKIIWYKDTHVYIENNNVVINKILHQGKDAVFLDYYNLFAVLGSDIYFVEPNGLLHNNPIKNEGYDKLYKFKNTFIAARNNQFTIFKFENYEWHSVYFEVEGVVVNVIDDCIYTYENNCIYKSYICSSIDIVDNRLYRVGNNSLFITNFDCGCVPTPYWHEKLTMKGFKMFAAYQNIVMAYVKNYICFINIKEVKLIRKVMLEDIITKSDNLTRNDKSYTKFFVFDTVESDQSKTQDDDINLKIEGKTKSDDYTQKNVLLNAIEDVNVSTPHVNDIAILENKCYILLNNNKLLIYDLINEKSIIQQIPHSYLIYTKGSSVFLRTLDSIISLKNHERIITDLKIDDKFQLDAENGLIIYHKNNTLSIKTEETLIIDNVSSYVHNKDYLAFIRHNRIVIFDMKSNLYQIYSKNELNQKLILINNNLVSYVERGNFEIIKPRIFTRKQIINYIVKNDYQRAFVLCAQNCINLDIFMNHNLCLTKLLQSTINGSQTINLVYQIYHAYTNNMITKPHTQSILEAIKNINYEEDTYELQTEPLKFRYNLGCTENEGKNVCICTNSCKSEVKICQTKDEFFANIMDHIRCDIISAKIYAKLNKLDKSLEIIKNNIEILKELKTVVNDEEIIKHALATYDLDFAKRAITYLQSNLYLDFIDSIQDKQSIDQRIAVNKTIDRKEACLFYKSQIGDTSLYIAENNLENLCKEFSCYLKTKSLGSFSFLNCFDKIIFDIHDIGFARIYADHIYKKNKEESINLYFDLLDYRKVFDIYNETEQFIKACEVNKNYIKEDGLYATIISHAIKGADYNLVAQIYENYKNDSENAYTYYIRDKKYSDAMRLKELGVDILDLDTKEIQTISDQIDNLLDRISNIKEKRAENCDMTMSFTSRRSSKSTKSTKSRLRNKVGSRYEKEWCMDQIRLCVESVLKIKNAYLEIGEQSLDNLFYTFKDKYAKPITKIFSNEDTIYDPDRPIIEKPDIDQL